MFWRQVPLTSKNIVANLCGLSLGDIDHDEVSKRSLVCYPFKLKGYKAHLCGLENVTFVVSCVCDVLTVLRINTDRRFSGKKHRMWVQLCKYSKNSLFSQEYYKIVLYIPGIWLVLQMCTLSMNIIKSGCVLQVTIKSLCSAVVTTN